MIEVSARDVAGRTATASLAFEIVDGDPELAGHRALADELDLPQTAREVPYGTPEMATEMQRLIASGMGGWHTISMAGHEDGVITWGETLDAASAELESIFRQVA